MPPNASAPGSVPGSASGPVPGTVTGTDPGPASAARRLPLSAAQRDIWLAHGLDPSGRRYGIGEYREILGTLDPELFARCWYQLAREADVLRIRGIGADEHGPWQLLHSAPGDRAVRLVDLSDEPDPAAAARSWMAEEMARPFDLAEDWLTRHVLLKAAPDHWFYLHTFHHLAIDGMGIALLDRRLVELYDRSAAGEPWGPSPFGALPDLLAEDAAYRQSPAAAEERAHWLTHLAGLPDPPRLAEGRTTLDALDAHVGKDSAPPFVRRTVLLPPAEADRLRDTARGHRSTWSMLVITLVAAYLHRISGSRELVLGLPVTGRTTDLARSTPGMVSNIVPLRIEVRGGESLAELLTGVVRETKRALRHQRTRYEDLRRELGSAGAEARIASPLVNIMAFAPGMSFCGQPTVQHNLSNGPVDDLAVGVYDLGPAGGLRIDFDAAPDVCDLAAVADHQDRFRRFVTSALDGIRSSALRSIELLDAEERHQVLGEWSGRRTEAELSSLGQRFERQARRTPEAPALIAGERTVSYGELDAESNRLARHLVTRGLGPGDLAGVLLDRGVEFAVAVLAVVKSGAGYALLDPDFPDERLFATARDAAVRLLVTDTRHADRLADGPWTTVRADGEAATTAAYPSTPLGIPLTPEHPACVMFTSGSTGRPKGILSSHRNLVSTLTAQTYATFGPGEVFLQCSPVSWDAFSLEFWGALLHGGATVLQPGQRPEPALVAELARARGVTMLQVSSSLFNYLTDEHPEAFDTVRTVFTGGEPASPTHVHTLQRLHPHLTVANGYGPAESMGFTTTYTVPRSTQAPATLPIGSPLTNKHAYVLDGGLRPVPPGVTGELYLSGDGLAYGYLGQSGTTATRFIPHPYDPSGARLYRTGDLAHWDRAGQLHYTGRSDSQVKVRGFRVEPTEIETALTTHPAVVQATVGVYGDRLAAHIVLGPAAATTAPPEIRAWLAERLPEHLVPAHLMVLDRLPLTPNGKIDRRALPPIEAPPVAAGRAPRTELEEIVRTLVTEVLDAPHPLTIDDDFFQHGGHSLRAARLTNRIAATLGTSLTLRDVFAHPTPAALAAHLTTVDGRRRALPPLVPTGDRPEPPPLSAAQARLWLVAGLEGAGGTAYNVPLTVTLDGELDIDALRAAFTDLTDRHAPLRTRIGTGPDGEPYQLIDPPALCFEHRRTSLHELDEELRTAASHPFDLTTEHPLRITLFQTATRFSTLLILLHHIATDGRSLAPLLADLSLAYTARRSGRAPDWAALPISYGDYAHWQHALPEDPDQLAFWRTALADLPEELGLVPDRPRPPVAGHRGGAVELDFGPELYQRVTALARAERCTPFMVLQAALAATLTRLGAGTDIPLGSPVAGRSDETLDGLVGFFVNTLVLRTDTSADPDFRTLLERVRTADLDAFAHQDVPFDRVLEAVNPARSLARHPLFQVCLALESGPADRPELPGLRVGAVEPVATGAVKFDLEFLLRADQERGLTGHLLFSSDLYERHTAERLAAALRRTLEQAVTAPETRLSALELLDEEERRRVLGEWAGHRAEIGTGSLVERFERQARLTPDAPALISGQETVSYGELDARSNRLARHLVARGLGPGGLTGVLLDRGVEFAVAVLAVVKSGAGYALLDPDFPDERLSATVRDAAVRLLVTDARHGDRLPGGPGATTVRMDDEAATIAAYPSTALPIRPRLDDPACVMFTSGSTGRPKGILSSHRNLVSTLTAQTYASFGPGEVFLQCSPVSWDAFSLEFWGALLHGGATVLQPGQRPEPALVADLARAHGVTMLQVSSSLFNYLTDEHPEAFGTVRTVFTGGEPASPTHVHTLQRLHPHLTVANGYGPAESMGFTTTHTVPRSTQALATLPIGIPLTNKHAYVLDGGLRPVPPGVTGELYLSGDGLAYGYLGQPGTTATRFVPHPFGPPGARLYRTGDLAHWDHQGRLHYTGRSDSQVKVRGFRVEPTEVETVLTTHPAVIQATVGVYGDRLVAHIVLAPAAATTAPPEVRAWLAERLPEHLVPARLMVLDRLPLTPNGKIDRRALPVPVPTASTAARRPRTPLEETVCAHFTAVLGTPAPLTLDDDFFEHGGHSLLAARLANRLAPAVGAALSLRDVFRHPTPAALTALLDGRLRSATAKPRRARPALRRRAAPEAAAPAAPPSSQPAQPEQERIPS
ncbi:non-ribosomal peptide synthetase [Streptomyces lichenis]|uniref:Amino acid adenylation domain-containing protein n=1 Tax=Streptomyces lichenis TaxID=2306967 RepID=A0ABT0IC04_9ACTN|nr:non-ribosomal peptide synthetase [Streptomyces lichenis]MCK8678848.1 amino acid adenylation domain-containing protein [Streptomyces lichenis]